MLSLGSSPATTTEARYTSAGWLPSGRAVRVPLFGSVGGLVRRGSPRLRLKCLPEGPGHHS